MGNDTQSDHCCVDSMVDVGKNGRDLPMTSNRRLSDETVKYIDSFFKK